MNDPYILTQTEGFFFTIWNGKELPHWSFGPFSTAADAYLAAVNYIYQPVPKFPIVQRPFMVVGLEAMYQEAQPMMT